MEDTPPTSANFLDADTLRSSIKEMNLSGALSEQAVESRMRNARDEHKKRQSEDRGDEESGITAARNNLKKIG